MAIRNWSAHSAKSRPTWTSGVFQAVQEAAITGLEAGEGDKLAEYCAIYKERRDVLTSALRTLGLECEIPRATFYVWSKFHVATPRVVYRARVEGSRGRNYARLRVR